MELTIHICSHLRPVAKHNGHWFHVNTNGDLSPYSCTAGKYKAEMEGPELTMALYVLEDEKDFNKPQVYLDTLEPVNP